MTIQELSLFCLGIEERQREEYKRTQYLMWASIQPHSKKSIKPESLLGIYDKKESYLWTKEEFLKARKIIEDKWKKN